MRSVRTACASIIAALALGGCGIDPSGVINGGKAPTGVAPGMSLYFLDEQNNLQPLLIYMSSLGTVAAAVDTLLRVDKPIKPGLHTDLPKLDTFGPWTTKTDPTTIVIHLNAFSGKEIGARGIDQIVCTALGVARQSGDAEATHAVVEFAFDTTGPQTCPQH
ncbi:hypothetical protein [Nocardia altamirensis]|uniref:hypothetical protein n=1 Tax=Nocardia altamirensis TaxID=472158 RepID=UPI000840940D|nr:hypothetical protein [Nocardia altamirensis]